MAQISGISVKDAKLRAENILKDLGL